MVSILVNYPGYKSAGSKIKGRHIIFQFDLNIMFSS